MEKEFAINSLYTRLVPVMEECGFAPVLPEDAQRGATAVYTRGEGAVMDFTGPKGFLRLVFSADRIHLLSGGTDVDLSDDSAFNLDSTFLFTPEEYDERDLKSLCNEISEYLTDNYTKKAQITSKKKGVQTVSKASARSGAMAYDPITLATKLAAMFPYLAYLKDEIQRNVDTWGEFLCEDFFVNHANPEIMAIIRENNPQKMKKLFGILGDIYEDGTNEVQSLIAVTILGQTKNDPTLIQIIIPYLTDTMLEPVLAANKHLGKSKSANMRLENPPKYKPKKAKKKKGGLLAQLMGGGGGLGQQ
jgi:hypothetical protein